MTDLPTRVRIDASSTCQLRCPVCPTSSRSNRRGVVGWGHLRLHDFEAFLDENDGVEAVELSSWGEIFLNPELGAILECGRARGVRLSGSGGVNLNHADDGILEALVVNKVEHLDVSIDGATDEVYRIYRRGGDLARVLENVRTINSHKDQYDSPHPEMTWKFIVFGHNEHEVSRARKMAEELGMGFRPCLNFADLWDVADYSPVRDREAVMHDTGMDVASTREYRHRHGRDYIVPCRQLWDAPQINWDGKLLGCCHNRWGDFGNVFEDGLTRCLESAGYRHAKRMLTGSAEPSDGIPCSRCSIYEGLRSR